MSKVRNNVRAPIREDDKGAKKVRRQIGAQIKIDIRAYEEHYPNKKLMIINDQDGDVQRWLDAGAELIPAKVSSRKIYAGFNDKADNEWVRFVAGQNQDGSAYYAYGLMMEPEDYDHYKLAPQRQRHEDIQAALKTGVPSESANFGGGESVKSYAANLPTGEGQGYNEIRSK
jgi:hypothetical protein